MTPKDEDQILAAMGLAGLKGEEKRTALDDILTTLNIRLGQRVAQGLNEDQAAQFAKFEDDADPDEVASWIKQNVPNYPQLIKEEAQKMHDEVVLKVKEINKRGHYDQEPAF